MIKIAKISEPEKKPDRKYQSFKPGNINQTGIMGTTCDCCPHALDFLYIVSCNINCVYAELW